MDEKLFSEMLAVVDEGYDLIQEYDSMPRKFKEVMLYPVETHTLAIIGNNPGINASMIAKELKKTLSASSQILKKLEQKGLVSRIKNPNNNREYNLYLTKVSEDIFKLHEKFESDIMERYLNNFKDFTNEEIKSFIKIQKALNQEYTRDIKESF